ncbi:hypothetical protein BH10ACI1_BH10ACI1_31420 [soil metagenome]
MKKTIQILLIAIFLFILSATIFAQNATRIKFRKGAVSAIVTSSLRGYESKKVFVIKVRAGQTLKIEQIRSENSLHYVYLTIQSPSGEDVSDLDASCNSQKEITPTESGDYVITVTECQKADAWRGSFKVKVWAK